MSLASYQDYRSILRHFSLTEGLIRGTGLLSLVIVNAAFALLPGFGAYGLIISNTIQHLINGIFEIPFGWLSDRFGWAKAFILSQGIKCFVPIADLLAVYAAWVGAYDWVWVFISLDAIIDAFVFAAQNGAYEAAYTEWYRQRLQEKFGEVSADAPPLFIKSLRYSIKIRLIIPVAVLGIIIGLQLLPLGFGSLTAYSATFVALAFIAVLRLLIFLRVYFDLRSIINVNNRHSTHSFSAFVSVWKSIKENLPAFRSRLKNLFEEDSLSSLQPFLERPMTPSISQD